MIHKFAEGPKLLRTLWVLLLLLPVLPVRNFEYSIREILLKLQVSHWGPLGKMHESHTLDRASYCFHANKFKSNKL